MDGSLWRRGSCGHTQLTLSNALWGAAALIMMTVVFVPGSACGQRWYGNGQLSMSDVRTTGATTSRSGQMMANTFINVEDVLFYKNRMRLAGRFDWRDDLHTDYRSYRPTYYFDLSSYGYSINTSYSPYSRRDRTISDTAGTSLVDVFYRDWRGALAVNVPRYPTLNLAYNRLRFFDRAPVRHDDVIQHNFVGETGYARERFALRGNYTRIRRDDRLNPLASDVIRAMSGTLSTTTPSWRFGNAGASYNIYDTKDDALVTIDSRSRTHTLSAMVSASPWRPLGLSASYSGRATSATQGVATSRTRSESMSAGLDFSPAPYFDASVVKSYQVEGWGSDGILEFVSMTGSLSRYLRQGVDTRLSASRTIYQRSNRVIEQTDSLGNLVSTQRLDHYAVDTYYGSVDFSPFPYFDLRMNSSLIRDIKSPQAERRYQMSNSAEGRFYMASNLEGRVGYSSTSLGRKLRPGRVFMESVNTGLAWLPRQNLNLSASYIFSRVGASSAFNRNENIGLYVNYSFRRAFTFYLSLNGQNQERVQAESIYDKGSVKITRPRTANVQLMIYTSRRSTLTLGYLQGRSGSKLDKTEIISKTWNGTFNFQI